MDIEKTSNSWCWCGQRLIMSLTGIFYCPRHKQECWEAPIKRKKIGKYSGKSKNEEWGLNWR